MVKNLPANARAAGDMGSIPWSGRSPGMECKKKKNPLAWQHTTVFFSEESHGQRSLVGYSPWGLEKSNMTARTPFKVRYTKYNNLSISLVPCN